MDLIEKRVIDYITDVDDKSSAPGGGSVASLVGALGIALAKMLAHFSKISFLEDSAVKIRVFSSVICGF